MLQIDQISLLIQTFCLKTIRLRYCLIGVTLIIKKLVLFQGHCKVQCFVNTESNTSQSNYNIDYTIVEVTLLLVCITLSNIIDCSDCYSVQTENVKIRQIKLAKTYQAYTGSLEFCNTEIAVFFIIFVCCYCRPIETFYQVKNIF